MESFLMLAENNAIKTNSAEVIKDKTQENSGDYVEIGNKNPDNKPILQTGTK